MSLHPSVHAFVDHHRNKTVKSKIQGRSHWLPTTVAVTDLLLQPVTQLTVGRSTMDAILALRLLAELHRNFNRQLDVAYYPPFASIAKGEVFVLLYVCFFVCSVNDFSATRGPIHAIFCMRA